DRRPCGQRAGTAARGGGIVALLNATDVRERYLRLRDEAGPEVTVVAATKYVPLEQLGVLAEAGSRWWVRTARRISPRSTRVTEMRFAGTSSATSSRTR